MNKQQAIKEFNFFEIKVLGNYPTRLKECYLKPSKFKEVAFNNLLDFKIKVMENYKVSVSATYITGFNCSYFSTMFCIYDIDRMTPKFIVKDTAKYRYVFDRLGNFYPANEMWKYLEVRI